MYVEQIYTNCLAHAAYYIESEGEAVLIDPLRDYQPLLELAKKRKATVKYVLETHFHADFVSSHVDVARETGAEIVYGPGAQADFPIKVVEDGEKLTVGNVALETIHTPGHTLESVCFVLYNEDGAPHAIFTGDTVFVGDVGRPDLAVKSDLTQEELAARMYDSIHNKIMPLPDHLILYPGHGPGSQCGKNIGKETSSTLGEQKKHNYAFQPMTKSEFIETLTDGLLPPPQYFFRDAAINRSGYDPYGEVMSRNLASLSVEAFEAEQKNGALVLDVRTPDEFETGFVPGAMNIGLNGAYAVWAGSLFDIEKPVVIVVEPGKEAEAVSRLARIGYEHVKGYLEGGMDAWKAAGKPLKTVDSVQPEEFVRRYEASETATEVLDVRRPPEYESAHIANATNIPLDELEERIGELKKDKPYYVHCAGGYRSMIASSILKQHGFENIVNIYGGMNKIRPVAQEILLEDPQPA